MSRSATPPLLALLALLSILPLSISWTPTPARARLLLPRDAERPDGEGQPLTLLQQQVEITIRDEHATTRVVQVLRNHTGSTLEGTYLFPLPEGGAVSDFATWDDGVRIPGVILEREEARRIYNSIVRRRVDPGLVEEQEGHVFSVQVFPIPPYGTKRLELEVTQLLDVDSGGVRYQFPLAGLGDGEAVDTFRLDFDVASGLPITGLHLPADTLDVVIDRQEPTGVAGHMEERGFAPSQDFILEYVVATEGLGLREASYHGADREEDGYFQVSVLPSPELAEGTAGHRDVALLFDTSYSMMGEGLDGSLRAAVDLVRGLDPADRVLALTFNDQRTVLDGGLRPGGEESAREIERFLRTADLGAGTDLEGALVDGLEGLERARLRGVPVGGGPRHLALVLITDGHQTVGRIDLEAIEERVMEVRGDDTRIFAFSVGQGTEDPLLRRLAERTRGHFEHVQGYGDLEYRLARFLDKLDLPLVADLAFRLPGRTSMVYPEQLHDTFLGSRLMVVGRYRRAPRGPVKVSGRIEGEPVSARLDADWSDAPHGEEYVARLWARARVDALLERIHVEGFREEWRDEIVELSRRYKFVTPYTSFLAAPRALLRPRVIKPGDPVLHVRAPEDTVRVSVVFPFGETKPARYDEELGLWVCRFLVPVGLHDGRYEAIVILTDGDGGQVRERKTFVIDSEPPAITVELDRDRVRRGDEVQVRVDAPPDTGRITATLLRADGAEVLRVPVRWDDATRLNTGRLTVPDDVAGGLYAVFVHATDFAANETGRHVEVEVL